MTHQPNFRRRLKYIWKNAQRLTGDAGEKYARSELAKLGYAGSYYDLFIVLRVLTKAKGRVLGRVGRAAIKRGQYAWLSEAAHYSHYGWDIREMPFDATYYKELMEKV